MKNLQIKKDVIEYLDYLHSENKPFEVCVMKPKEKNRNCGTTKQFQEVE